MGKAYANRKSISERPESDFYATPLSLVWELNKLDTLFDFDSIICDPASGEGNLLKALNSLGYKNTVGYDIRKDGKDFLDNTEVWDNIIMNPPFSLFDYFILKAKESVRHKIISIIKTNFFGACSRNNNGVWKNLKHVFIFDRKVDFRTDYKRTDGLFHVGNLVSGWGIWDKDYDKDYWTTSILSVNAYAKLGSYEKDFTCECGHKQKEYKFSEKITCKKCNSVVYYTLNDNINPTKIIQGEIKCNFI